MKEETEKMLSFFNFLYKLGGNLSDMMNNGEFKLQRANYCHRYRQASARIYEVLNVGT